MALQVRDFHPLWLAFPSYSSFHIFTTGLFRFRSPLLAESRLMSFPMGTKMFQFPTFACQPLYIQGCIPLYVVGCPIQKSADQRLFAPPHGLSQRITSFFASSCQGIHQMPFCAWLLSTLKNNCLFFCNLNNYYLSIPRNCFCWS